MVLLYPIIQSINKEKVDDFFKKPDNFIWGYEKYKQVGNKLFLYFKVCFNSDINMWKFCKNNYTFNKTDKEIYFDGGKRIKSISKRRKSISKRRRKSGNKRSKSGNKRRSKSISKRRRKSTRKSGNKIRKSIINNQ